MLDVSIVVTAPLLLLLQTAGEPPIRQAVLTNDTRRLIVEIYVSDDGANNWKEDQLGSEYLSPGSSILVDIDDRNGNCRVDVKAVFDNGAHLISRNVNACLADGHTVSIRR